MSTERNKGESGNQLAEMKIDGLYVLALHFSTYLVISNYFLPSVYMFCFTCNTHAIDVLLL